jgi:hypothetical protein
MNAQGPDTVTPKGLSLAGPALFNAEYSKELQQYVHVWEMAVANQTTLPTRRFGDFELSLQNERNRAESRLRWTTIHSGDKLTGTFVQRTEKDDELALQKLMPFINRINITKQIVPAGTAPSTLSWTKLKSVVRYIDTIHAEKEDWDVVTDFHSLTDNEKDPETDFFVDVIREVVEPGTEPSGATGIWDEIEQVDEYHALRTRRVLDFVQGEISYENIRYTFPALLIGWDTDSIFLEAQSRTFFVLHPQIRQEETKIVVAKQVTNYSAEPEIVDPVLFSFKAEDLRYDGIIFNIDVRSVLFNNGSVFVGTNPADAFWGPNIMETFEWGPTNVTASDYLSLVGEEVKIGHTSQKVGKYNLYKTVQSYITLE